MSEKVVYQSEVPTQVTSNKKYFVSGIWALVGSFSYRISLLLQAAQREIFLIYKPFSAKNIKAKRFFLRKVVIFIKIAPTYINPQQPAQRENFLIYKPFSAKISKAKRVFVKENGHFHQDRPHLFFVQIKSGSLQLLGSKD